MAQVKKATLQVNAIAVVDNTNGRKIEGATNRVIRVELPEDVALDVISDIKGDDVDPETYLSKNGKTYMDLWLSKAAHAELRGKELPALVTLEFYLTAAAKELFARRNGEEGSAKRLTGTARVAKYVQFNLPDVYETERDNRGRQSSRMSAGADSMGATVARALSVLAE